jgi:TonB-linked SusC/RagA family outer membrane protein
MKLKHFLVLLIFVPAGLLAQKQIIGTVTSADDGIPLPGASVVVKGTTTGTTTDFDGNYTLDEVPSDATLIFSYIGFLSSEVPVNGQATINLALRPDAQQLEEVVVTGYTTERKADLTGAVTVVELGPVEGQAMSSGSAVQALQGRVPGLFIEKSGDPTGNNNRILIRGVTTLGNNDPLFVIDGIPTVRQEVFASLNPSVIESVQVLKDASASSIYGARAGNGVIIVTTKNKARAGEGEKMAITINSNVSVLSERQQRYDMLNSQQRGEVLWGASVNDGADPNGAFGEIYNFNWNGDFNNPVLNSVSVQPFVGGDSNVPAGDTDWQDELYETGFVLNNDISVSGGTDKSFHLLNIGYLKNTGILKHTNYDRYTAKLNSNFKFFDNKLRIGVNTQFSTSDETLASPDVGSSPTPALGITLAPTIPLRDANGEFGGPIGAGYSDRNNPVLMQFLNRWDNTERTSIFGNVFAEVQILDNLVFRSSVGLDFNDFRSKDIEPTVNNGFITRSNNRLIIDSNKSSSVVFTNTLNYNLEFGDHRFGLLVGTESVKNDFDSVLSQADGFAVETENYFVLGAATGARTTNGRSSGSRLLSQFGKLNYAFGNKYLASVTVRRDGSSRFGPDNRYGIFPAFTAGWRISEEEFLKDNEIISDLKLRAGYGEVGNQNIGDLARFGIFEARYADNKAQFGGGFWETYNNVGTAYDLNGNNGGTLPSGFVSTQAANPALKWETTKEINIGVDFGLFNNAVVGSFDYFTRDTDDILTTPPIASVLGEGQQRVLNGASTKTNGWELSLAYSKTFDSGLTFGVSTNFGAFRDEITFLPEEVRAAFPGTAQNSIVGQSQFSIFGFKTDGLFESQADIESSPDQVGARPGGLKFQDINGDGTIDGDDRDFIGNTLPDLEYGIRINLGYKNFDFSVFGSGVTGRIGRDPYLNFNNFIQARENAGLGVQNAWTPTNTDTDIPSLSLAFNDLRTSDYLFRNNSYFKIRNLQIGYSLPEDMINKWGGMTKMRLYFQGENLLWFTPQGYIGADPERTDISTIPVPTVLSLGLNVNF